jgi:hypothetical protein
MLPWTGAITGSQTTARLRATARSRSNASGATSIHSSTTSTGPYPDLIRTASEPYLVLPHGLTGAARPECGGEVDRLQFGQDKPGRVPSTRQVALIVESAIKRPIDAPSAIYPYVSWIAHSLVNKRPDSVSEQRIGKTSRIRGRWATSIEPLMACSSLEVTQLYILENETHSTCSMGRLDLRRSRRRSIVRQPIVTSHLQTGTLSDALDAVDRILSQRATRLRDSNQRSDLAHNFSPKTYHKFFGNWAFSAAEYDDLISKIAQLAPELADRLQKPASENDFTIIGHCSLDLHFQTDPNGADPIDHRLKDGAAVRGAKVTSKQAKRYANGLVALPVASNESVYFFPPEKYNDWQAAGLATSVYAERGKVEQTGITLIFPQARTKQLPDYGWVMQLRSECGLYYVRNFVNSGEALVDENGFFARETQVVQMRYPCLNEDRCQIIIDGPFVVFFADSDGVHAAAWFDKDSFIVR